MKPQTELQKKLTDTTGSPLKKYLDVFLGEGEESLISLFRYEFIMSFFGPMPGAIGFITRKYLFPKLLKRTGNNPTFGRNITLRHPKKISIGNNTVIDDYCVFDAKGEGSSLNISVGDNVIISRNNTFSCKGGTISIGNNTNIGINNAIYSGKSVKIGSNILIASSCYIFGDSSHRSDRLDIPIIQQGQEPVFGITIEDGTWIGAGAKIMDGVVIGHDSIIGAGAVVTKSVPPFSIAVGIPAKVIRSRKENAESVPS